MKVLLTTPKEEVVNYGNVFPPLQLGILAAVLEKAGYQVAILDQRAMNTSKEELKEFVLREKPDLVGFSCSTPEVVDAYTLAAFIKSINPAIKVILGGPHPSALPKETLEGSLHVDYVVHGESENTIQDLLHALQHGTDLADVNGLAYRKDGKVIVTSRGEFIQNLDELPLPAYHLMPMEKYLFYQEGWQGRKFFTMMTTRGCPFLCTFCSHPVYGRVTRFRSPKNVVDEIEYLYRNYGVRSITFLDDIFTLQKQRVMEICKEIQTRNLDLKWHCTAYVRTVDEEMLKEMKKAGCAKISYGVETGDPDMLLAIKKGIRLEHVQKAFELSKKVGITTLAYFMIGMPGETKESLQRTKEFAKKLNPDYISVAVLCPMPGSDTFAEYREQFSDDWTRYQFTPFNTLPVLKSENFTGEQLQSEMKKFYREFYFRPRYILSRLKKVRSFDDFKFYVKKATSMMQYWF